MSGPPVYLKVSRCPALALPVGESTYIQFPCFIQCSYIPWSDGDIFSTIEKVSVFYLRISLDDDLSSPISTTPARRSITFLDKDVVVFDVFLSFCHLYQFHGSLLLDGDQSSPSRIRRPLNLSISSARRCLSTTGFPSGFTSLAASIPTVLRCATDSPSQRLCHWALVIFNLLGDFIRQPVTPCWRLPLLVRDCLFVRFSPAYFAVTLHIREWHSNRYRGFTVITTAITAVMVTNI